MGLIYVEFRSRRQWAELALFHGVTARKQYTWTDEYPEDVQLLNLARTWRLGPEPEYLTIYHSPASGVGRLGEWERIFRSGEVSFIESSARLAFRIDRAGCYRDLVAPVAGEGGPYYVEYFSTDEDDADDRVAEAFTARRDGLGGLTLHLLALRIGCLAPPPGGLAVWGLRDYTDLERVAVGAHGAGPGVMVTEAGVYADLGEEIL